MQRIYFKIPEDHKLLSVVDDLTDNYKAMVEDAQRICRELGATSFIVNNTLIGLMFNKKPDHWCYGKSGGYKPQKGTEEYKIFNSCKKSYDIIEYSKKLGFSDIMDGASLAWVMCDKCDDTRILIVPVTASGVFPNDFNPEEFIELKTSEYFALRGIKQ